MKNPKSILNEHLNLIFRCTDIETCRKLFLGIVDGSKINEYSQTKMKLQANQCNSLVQLQLTAKESHSALAYG